MSIRVVSALCSNACSGRGSCWTTKDGFGCRCRFGYAGKACELIKEAATSASSVPSESSLIPLILFSVAALFLVGLGLWMWHHWKPAKVADIAGKVSCDGDDVAAIEGSTVEPSAPAAEHTLDV